MTDKTIQAFPGRFRGGEALALIAGTAFVAHFLCFSFFGLYEDDFVYTLPWSKLSFHGWLDQLIAAFTQFPQGRPIYYTLQPGLAALFAHQGNLGPAYLFSSSVVGLNGYLVYRLLLPLLGRRSSLFAGLVFVLYPIDTSRQILMHQAAILLPITGLLLALFLYRNHRRILAFGLAGCLLLTYESTYLPFIIAPLLAVQPPRKPVRNFFVHSLVFFLFAAMVVFVRGLLGEERAATTLGTFREILPRIVQACVQGPLNSLKMMAIRPLDALGHSDVTEWLIIVVSASIVALILFRVNPQRIGENLRDGDEKESEPRHVHELAFVALAGAISWAISYALAFRPGYYPPIVSIGRLSAVHSVGAVGGALFIGALFALAERSTNSFGRSGLVLGSSLLIGTLIAFGFEIQRTQYVREWSRERSFWEDILSDCGDIADGEIILFQLADDPTVGATTEGFPPFGQVNYEPLGLAYFCQMPKSWLHPPRVYTFWKGCPIEASPRGLLLHTPIWDPALWPIIEDHRFIFFQAVNGKYRRSSEPLTIGDRIFEPKPFPKTPFPPLKPSREFLNLTRANSASTWYSIKSAVNYPP